MSRISTKNARRIRAGIKVGQRMVSTNRAGMVTYLRPPIEALAHRACMRILATELDRLAKDIIEQLKAKKAR